MKIVFRHSVKMYSIVAACCLLLSPRIHAQKEKCLEGNCKNGQGLKRITDKAGYQFYEMGSFKSGTLNGNGYKVAALWNSYNNYKNIEDTLTAAFNNNMLLPLSLYKYYWYEKGDYTDGTLNGKGLKIACRNDGTIIIYSEGLFKNGLLHGNGIKKITKEGRYFKYDSIAKKTVDIPAPEIMYSGIFEEGFCSDCIKTDEGYGGVAIHMYGKGLDRDFISGWVIKDYVLEQEYSTRYKNTEPYRALYIGGFEIATLPGTALHTKTGRIELGDGRSYTGELDEQNRPYGFGKIEYAAVYGETYEGMVDNGKPQGYGYYYARKNDFASITGGRYRNGKIIYGASIKAGVEVIRFGINDENAADPEFREDLFNPLQGPFTRYYYQLDNNTKKWNLSRQASGYNINGFSKETWVAKGQTAAEKRKQRTVTGGSISISDLLMGDIIVVDGYASPVVNDAGGIFTLKNGKKVSAVAGVNSVRLSRHKDADFFISCDICKGAGQTSYTYQRKPEQVVEFYYVTETITGDYTILKHPVLRQHTVTKTFPPVTRMQSCSKCNAAGFLKNITELTE